MEEHRPGVDRRPPDVARVDPTADPVARLEHDDLDPGVVQRPGRRESGGAGSDDEDGGIDGFERHVRGPAAGHQEEARRQGFACGRS